MSEWANMPPLKPTGVPDPDDRYGERCRCRKSPSWFASLINRVTRKWGGTKHELDQWQDALEEIRKNK